jgi:hypothetical protein
MAPLILQVATRGVSKGFHLSGRRGCHSWIKRIKCSPLSINLTPCLVFSQTSSPSSLFLILEALCPARLLGICCLGLSLRKISQFRFNFHSGIFSFLIVCRMFCVSPFYLPLFIFLYNVFQFMRAGSFLPWSRKTPYCCCGIAKQHCKLPLKTTPERLRECY